MSKLDDTIYGIAYRNHRFQKDEYNISFYTTLRDKELALSCMDRGTKPIQFEFRPVDLIKKE